MKKNYNIEQKGQIAITEEELNYKKITEGLTLTSNLRLKRFLFTLGFDYVEYLLPEGKCCFAFKNSAELAESINFFTDIRRRVVA